MATIPKMYGQYKKDGYLEVDITKPQVYTRGPWSIVTGAHFDVVVYDKEDRFLEVVRRKCEPMAPFGPWSVWRFSYKGKKYSSLVNDIYGHLTVRLSQKAG